jgi:hypothetical protein
MDFLVGQNAFQGKDREREKTNKARLIAKCYLQQPIVYFIETYILYKLLHLLLG